jgi:cytochrome d ubiquinol oxidase subunit I
VPVWLHTLSSFLVALGTTLSAFWILALNSWMQTPQGHVIVDGVFYAADWFAIIFNPSFPYRLAHMLLASALTACFLLAGLSAYQLLRNRAFEPAQRLIRVALTAAAVLVPVQIAVGDLHGINTLEHQPAKVAAIEGIWSTERNVPLILFAWPNEKERRNDYAVSIPGGASLILKHDWHGELQGLDQFIGKHPPVAPVFFAFRIMVGIGVLMLVVAWTGCWYLYRKQPFPRWLLRTLTAMTFSGWVAVLAGWLVTEIGRQPYLVYGLMTTAEAASDVPASSIAITLIGYCVVYALLLISYLVVVTQLARSSAGVEAQVPASGESQPTGTVYGARA